MWQTRQDIAAALPHRLGGVDGVRSIERFQSLVDPERMLLLSF